MIEGLRSAVGTSLDFLDKLSQKPKYAYCQVVIVAGITYFPMTYLSSIPPIRATSFVVVTYCINQYVAEYFGQLFKDYESLPLVPLSVQIGHIGITLLTTKMIFGAIGQPLSFRKIARISTIFLFAVLIFQQIITILDQFAQKNR
jgi:hypothetical protein